MINRFPKLNSRNYYSLVHKNCTQSFYSSSKLNSLNVVDENVLPPKNARVVVCGGGVMGASVSYFLAKLGWGSETVLIEQNR